MSSISVAKGSMAGLTPLQIKTLSDLLMGWSKEAAAERNGVGRRTLYRWMEPGHAVRRAYEEAQSEQIAQVVSFMGSAALRMSSVLVELATTQSAPAASRVRAAKSFLEEFRQFRGLAELEARLLAVEDALNLRASSERSDVEDAPEGDGE